MLQRPLRRSAPLDGSWSKRDSRACRPRTLRRRPQEKQRVTSQLLHSFFTASSQLLHSCNEPASSMHSPQLL
jgi:hypothetical protein